MQGSTVSQYITTVSLYHSIAADHRFAVFTLVQSCVECVVSVTDACPRNDRHVCWHCSSAPPVASVRGRLGPVPLCVHTTGHLLSPAPAARCRASLATCSVLSYTVDISLWRPGCTGTTDHSSSTHLPLPPLMGQDMDTTLTLLATVEISAHILHNGIFASGND